MNPLIENEAILGVTALINAMAIGLFLAVMAWALTRAMPWMNAATRYLVWFTAFAITALLPIYIYLKLERPHWQQPPAESSTVVESTPVAAEAAAPVKPSTCCDTPLREPSPFDVSFPIQLTTESKAPLGLPILLGLLAAFGAARFSREWRMIRNLRRRCTTANEALHTRFHAWMRYTGTRRPIQLLISDDIRGPLALGLWRPAIALPSLLVAQLSEAELDQIILHEMAHLRRRDDWTRFLQRVVQAVFCFNPTLIWLGRKLDLEREIACDDWVIHVTGEPRGYATCLARVVELAGFRRGWALATGAAEKKSHLFRRIELMLDKSRNRKPRASRFALAVTIVAGIIVFSAVSRVPSVFAFNASVDQDWPPPAPTAPPAPRAVRPLRAVPPTPPAAPSVAAPAAPTATPYAYLPAPPPPTPAAAALAPETPEPPPPPPAEPPEHRSHWRSYSSDNGRTMEVRMDGAVEFTDDDRDVKSISAGGRLLMEARADGHTKRLEVRAESNGALARNYWIDGQRRSPEEAKPWLAGILPGIIREHAIGAGPRIQRIAQQGGPSAALREIGLIHSDGSKRVYIQELLARVRLDDGQLGDTMRLTRSIGSDGEKARLIVSTYSKFMKAGLRERLFEAIDSIGSDGERRRAIQAVLQGDGANSETVTLSVKSASRIGSDGEKAAVLTQAAWPISSEESRRAWFKAANTIGSDGEKARALMAILDRNSSAGMLVDVANSARGIGSDGEKARVLMRLSREDLRDSAARAAYFKAADSIASDGEHARTLLSLLGHGELAEDLVVDVVHSATRISSDGEKSRVLLRVLENYGRNGAVSREVRSAAKTISSDGEYRRVMNVAEQRNPTI